MDTIKKALHPKESAHHKDAYTSISEQPNKLAPDTQPDHETKDRLGSEPNVIGTNRAPSHEDFPSAHHHTSTSTTGDQPRINRGQHQPRQPVGATGVPAGPGEAEPVAGGGRTGAKARAEAANNFVGTNPHPSHSA
ncbi:hypothetical protein DHEL01_v202550 [Diaporthe helianthi]|uniref:Uncharacterized protein n=1 Tax=Diaporthe helianthi TaxID=158607 RepID=A0A2P5I983_DIAHE|nr:hypothetical protein DHEL01_v202550 [Diaporthe helianthi]